MSPRVGPCVLVCHPGRQHSHHAAAALARAGLLAGYWAGLPPSAEELRGARLPGATGEVERFRWAPFVRRLLERSLPGRSRAWGDHLANRLFDRWAAARLARLGPRLVVGYEMACASTFAKARQLGAITVLDAASLHPARQDAWRRPAESDSLHRRIRTLKDLELERADRVLVASRLAEESYRDGGVPPAKVAMVPLGVDLARFRPGPGGAGALTVLFAGKLSEVKGVDFLLAAFGDLRRRHPASRLRLAAQGRWPGGVPAGVEIFRPSPEELVSAYQRADLFVLPSRLDGFGLVVPEALACGTPVIVTDRVGAKDLVTEGKNGWVVPGENAGALAARLRSCAENLDHLRGMRAACAESVQHAGWESYEQRLVAVIGAWLDGTPR